MVGIGRSGVAKVFRPALARDRRPRDSGKGRGREERAQGAVAALSAAGPEFGTAPFLAQLMACRMEPPQMRHSGRVSPREALAGYAEALARIAFGHRPAGSDREA